MCRNFFAAVLAGALCLAQTAGGGTGRQRTTPNVEPASSASTVSQGARAFALVHEADALFGLTNLWTFHFTIEPAEWAAMEPKDFRMRGPQPPGQRRARPDGPSAAEAARTNPPPGGGRPGAPGPAGRFPYARATLEFQGQTYAEIGVRFKGNSSFNASRGSLKHPLKLDFNRFRKGQKFLDLTQLNLNNNAMDPSLMREALAYEVFRQAGLPAPRTAFARVYLTVPGQVEREYVGLYTIVEEVDDHFLRANFGTKKGLLLKPEMMQGVPYLGEDWAAYAARYQPKSAVDMEDARRLMAFTWLVDQGDDAVFRRQIGAFVDVEQYLRFVAVQSALANLDSPLVTGHNYYLYLHPSTRRFLFLPWDLNEAFGSFFPAGRPEQQADLSIARPFAGRTRLFERLMQMPELKAAYRRQFEELLAGPFRKEKLFADLEAVATVTRPALAEDKTVAREQFEQNLAEGVLTDPMPSDARPRPRRDIGGDRPAARRVPLDPEPTAGGPGRRPAGGGLPGMRMPKPPLRPFIAGRVASIQAQLAGNSEGYVPNAGRFVPPGGPGGFGGPGGPGGPGFGPGMVVAEAFMRVGDADQDGRLSSAEFAGAWKRLFTRWDTDQSGKLDVEKLTAGLIQLVPPPPGADGPPRDFGGPPPVDGPPPDEAARPRPRPERPPGEADPGSEPRPPRFGQRPGVRGEGPLFELARQIVRAADANKDGAVSSAELEKARVQWFQDWDQDKNGALDLRELAEGWMRLLGPRPDFGPPPG